MLIKINKQILIYSLFGVYIAVLLKLLIFRYSETAIFNFSGSNFIPFKTIIHYLINSPSPIIGFINLVGNIVVFIPLGIFIPLLHPSNKWKTVFITGLVVSLIAEIIQGIFMVGVFDVDDILLNALGTFVGYLIYIFIKIILKKFNSKFDF